MRKFCSTPHFWSSHRRIYKILKKRVEEQKESSEFWTHKMVDDGVMERSFLHYLLNNDPFIHFLGGQSTFTALPDFGLNTLRYNRTSTTTCLHLESIFKQFQENSNNFHCFILGQTTHFVSLIAIKVDAEVEVVFFDSKNQATLLATDEDLEKIRLEILQRRRIMRKDLKEATLQWYSRQDLDRLKSCRYIAWLFHDCILGKRNIRSELLKLHIDGFLENYLYVMKGEGEASLPEDKEIFKTRLLEWLRDYMPPPVLSNNTKQIMDDLGVSFIPDDMKLLFVNNFVKPVIHNINFEENETLCKLLPIMQWFKEKLL